jgi:hypothetical protein
MRYIVVMLGLGLLMQTLSSCWLPGKRAPLPQQIVIRSEAVSQTIRSDYVSLETNSYYDKRTIVKSVRIFVGETWSIDAKKYLDSWFYYYQFEGSCSLLPQGKGITVRYEMYDAAGVVVQEESV